MYWSGCRWEIVCLCAFLLPFLMKTAQCTPTLLFGPWWSRFAGCNNWKLLSLVPEWVMCSLLVNLHRIILKTALRFHRTMAEVTNRTRPIRLPNFVMPLKMDKTLKATKNWKILFLRTSFCFILCRRPSTCCVPIPHPGSPYLQGCSHDQLSKWTGLKCKEYILASSRQRESWVHIWIRLGKK